MLLIAIVVVSAPAKLWIDKSDQNTAFYKQKAMEVANHSHRAVRFDTNVLIREVYLLSSFGGDFKHSSKDVALVILVLDNLLLASFHSGFGGILDVLDSPQGSPDGWREQYCRYKVQLSQVRGHSAADGESGKQGVYGFHVIADICALTHEAKHLAVEELTEYIEGVPTGQVSLVHKCFIPREMSQSFRVE